MKNKSIMELLGGNSKKIKANILTFFAVGVALIVLGGSLGGGKGKETKAADTENIASEGQKGGNGEIEDRLKAILSKVNGAGRVDVMVTVKGSRELVVAQEYKEEVTSTDETAAGGDKRNIKADTKENTYVIIEDEGGSGSPLVLKETQPEIEGVIIVAEGGDDILVKSSLIRAAEAVLGVPTHKIEVLKMKA